MRSELQQRVATALADRQLRIALDRTTSRFVSLRRNGLESLPDAEEVRDRARAIRLHTIDRLADYLEEFEAGLKKLGGEVHWAGDAAEARAIVLGLAARYDARRIIKSKSMVSEEVDLNHALEAAGLDVVESDLGEYIIQLAGERPSHIIAPAIHKTREQVGELFHEKLGLPLTSDPAVMTAAARERLRTEFLSADIGISGVNFGVAATGTLAIVTNEGNASIGVSAPHVHVAMMGIERIVPTLEDLGVMLQVLARSATGQKLSVYTDLITGPRRAASDPDGPDHLHVVLVDNGRSRLVGGELAEVLACIRCGACLNICPVYREIGGHAYGSVYPGPIGAVLTPALEGLERWGDLPQASSLCGACRDVCPVRLDIPRMLLTLRARSVAEGRQPAWSSVGLRLFRFTAERPWAFRSVARLAALATRWLARGGWVERLPGPLAGWTASRSFPALAGVPFSEQLRRRGGAE